LVGQAELVRAESITQRYGEWTLILTRAVPVLAEASVIFAGIARMPFPRFIAITALSNLGIAVAYAAVGAFSMRMESFLVAFAGAIALPGIAAIALRRFEHKSGAPRS
jgi:membrane protein DedA with SNARE-associated domain